MATKNELSDEINEVLGTQIEWHRLLEDDIKLLHEMVMDGALTEPMAKQMAKKHGKAKVENEIDEWFPGKFAAKLI